MLEDFEKPWIEKYRPSVLSDVVGNQNIISSLKDISLKGNLPNLILTGPPGTGKTTAVLALAKELLGSNYKTAVLELNASDERGIDVVRDRIKNFATQKVHLKEGLHKIVLLDEADSMTESAQQALRVIIVDNSNTTRFVFACNDSSKLISAIQSRCTMLRFSRLESDEIKKNIIRIINLENKIYKQNSSNNNTSANSLINYNNDGINALIETCDGDMRYAINNLQSTVFGLGLVSRENVYKIVDVPNPKIMLDLLGLCSKGDLNNVVDNIEQLINNGYGIFEIISVLSRIIQNYKYIDERVRIELIKTISKFKVDVLSGHDSKVQVYGFFAEIIDILFIKNKVEINSNNENDDNIIQEFNENLIVEN